MSSRRAFALLQAQQVLGGGHQVGLGQDAGIAALDAQLLVDLVTADAAQIVALRIEEQPLDQRAGIGRGGRIARAQPAVNVLERLLLVLGGILLHALDDDPVVQGGIHHLDLVDAQFGDLLDHRLGQRLEGARHHQALFLVHGVLDQHLVRQVFALLRLFDAEFLDFVKQLQDLLIRAPVLILAVLALAFAIQEGEGAEEGGGQELPAALLAVQIDVEQVAGVELRLIPGAAVGDDAEGMQRLAVGMLGGLEGQAGRPVQLADDDALGAVDDKRALRASSAAVRP